MTQCFYLEILPPISPIPLPPRKRLSRMCEFIKTKKLTFENEMGLSSNHQIKPLLSGKVERLDNLIFDIMKYEFSKLYDLPVQPIKTEYQNEEQVKTDFVSDEEVAAELNPEYNPPCSQLTYKAYIQNAKERILAPQKKESIQGIFRIFVNINFIVPNDFNINFDSFSICI